MGEGEGGERRKVETEGGGGVITAAWSAEAV